MWRGVVVAVVFAGAAFACGKQIERAPVSNNDVPGDGRIDASVPPPSDGGGAVDAGACTGFGDAVTFGLPTGYDGTTPSFSSVVASQSTCTGGAIAPGFQTIDLDGDLIADLVVFSRCGDAATGTTRWLVYKGGASGFGPSSDVTLPTGYGAGAFAGFSGTMACTGTPLPSWLLADVDGDLRPDLVVTRRCNDAATGTTRWLVYKNTGAGFAADPTDFALPGGYTAAADSVPFGALAGSLGCAGANVPEYAVLDMDGDRRPDLLLTQRCGDSATGSTQWLVHLNTGTGFTASPAVLALPTAYGANVFPSLASAGDCKSATSISYATVDMDGDLRPDLVVTRRCADPLVGGSRWLVHANKAGGFGPASVFALPPGYAAAGGSPAFTSFGSNALSCTGANVPIYGAFDVDGDFRPDLVVFARCNDNGVGRSSWAIYRNDGAGFAPTATTFALPSGYAVANGGLPFPAFSGVLDCVAGKLAFATIDVTGDRRPDLVVTQRCGDATTGRSAWLVHPNLCAP